MLTLISCDIIPLLIAALIGLVTGWWAWAGRVRVALVTDARPAPTLARVAQPIPAPEPMMAPPFVTPPPAPVAMPLVDAPVAPAEPTPESIASEPIASGISLTALGIPAAIGAPDDLLQLKGVGPKLNALLNSLGVHRFDQIAAWGGSEIALVDGHLGSFRGRIVRDNWVEQAGLLASGAIAAFEAKFGQLDSENRQR